MRHTITRIGSLWRPHTWIGLGLAVAMLLQTVFTVVLALTIKLIIDAITGDGGGLSAAAVVLLLLGGFVVSAGAGVAAGYLRARASARILADVRTQAFDHIQRLSMGFLNRSQRGDLLARFSSDVAQLSQGVIKAPLDGLKSLAALAFFVPVMLVLDWRLTLLTVVVMPIAVYAAHRFGPDPGPALDEEKSRIADVLDEVDENLAAQPVIRAFGLARRSRTRFRDRIARLMAASTRAVFRVSLLSTLSEFSVALAQLGIVGVGAALALDGSLEPGTLAAFVALLTEFAWESTVVGGEVLPRIAEAGAGIRRIDSLLAAGPTVEQSPTPQPIAPVSDRIEFENVTFSYDHDGAVQLRDISLIVPAGRHVAIVGPSGSGKSTLLSLLLRFYDPSAGRITFDSVSLRDLDTDSLRGEMAVVFQDTLLFTASLRENVTMANPDASDDQLEAAARGAGLDAVVAELPRGWETVVGPGAQRLSGGQRQRVGIARALVRDPSLLLLDEVTAALDPATEAAVNDTLRSACKHRTTISVTHRLNSVSDADLLVVMQHGAIAEAGTFDELRDGQGAFAAMWDKQLGFTVSPDGRDAQVTPERLRAIPLLHDLGSRDLTALANELVSDHHAAGEDVVLQGDPADRFYLIARGIVEVIVSNGELHETIAHLEDGDFFGEMAFLDGAPRNATVRTLTPTVTLSLDRSQFWDLLDSSPSAEESVRAIAAARAEAPGP